MNYLGTTKLATIARLTSTIEISEHSQFRIIAKTKGGRLDSIPSMLNHFGAKMVTTIRFHSPRVEKAK